MREQRRIKINTKERIVLSHNKIDYSGKKVVVTGGASGMGESVVRLISELGAEVYVLDIKEGTLPVKQYIPVNLAKKDTIDAAVAALPKGIDAVFHAAGIAGPIYSGARFSDLDIVTINYIGMRRCIEGIIPKMNENSAIVLVSSIAAFFFRGRIADYTEFVNMDDWDASVKYISERMDDPKFAGGPVESNRTYSFAKECLCIYAMYRCWALSEKKIRINTICPGPTTTPMHGDFREITGNKRDSPMPSSPVGREAHPDEMAGAMLFLNSDVASYISGQDICVDYGLAANWLYQGIEDHLKGRDHSKTV